MKEEARQARGQRLVESVARDVAYALRVLRKSPGFTTAVVFSLALGIGANTAIFTLMDAVMWRMLPVKDPEGLLVAGRQQGGTVQPGFTYSRYRLIRDDNSVASVAGYATAPINVSVDGPPEPTIQGQLVSGDYFSLLGVNPAIGRAIGPDDDRVPNGHPVAMLSHGYWERRFARDPSVDRQDDPPLGDAFHHRRRHTAGVLRRGDRDGAGHLPADHDAAHGHAGFREPAGKPDHQQGVGSGDRAYETGHQSGSGRCGNGRGVSEPASQPRTWPSREGTGPLAGPRGADSGDGGVSPAPAVFPAFVRSAGHGRPRAPDRLRQHRQSAPGACRGAAAGARHAARARSRPASADAAVTGRKRGPRGVRGPVRRAAGALGHSASCRVHVVGTDSDRVGSQSQSPDSGVHGGGIDGDRPPVRARAGVASHAN